MKPNIQWANARGLLALDIHADSAFAADVLAGLNEDQKRIPSTWLYDRRGSELFEEITTVAEYYLTRAETYLLTKLTPELGAKISGVHTLVEIGSGSSRKTRLLLTALRSLKRYVPVDISAGFLHDAVAGLARDFPALTMQPVIADFTAPFALPPWPGEFVPQDNSGNLGFFPGSTIGNFAPPDAIELLTQLGDILGAHARLLIGVDTTQDPALLIPAYDDAAGVTAEFNLNLLDRINRELDGDFDRRNFKHLAGYDPKLSRIEMHLVSQRAHEAHVCGRLFPFAAGETIHTENAYKHTPTEFLRMAHTAHWRCEYAWQDDSRTGFTVFLLQRSRTRSASAFTPQSSYEYATADVNALADVQRSLRTCRIVGDSRRGSTVLCSRTER